MCCHWPAPSGTGCGMCLVSHSNLSLCWLGACCSGYFVPELPAASPGGGAGAVWSQFLTVSLSVVSTSSAPPPINRRLALAALGVGVFAPNLLAACTNPVTRQAENKKQPSAAHLKFQPADSANDVVPIAPISVEVGDGWLQHVALTNSSGKAVAGAFNQDRTVYTVTEPLGYDATY